MQSSAAPVFERERERERVHKILLGVIVFVGILLYTGFNVWVWRYSKSGSVPSPKEVWQTVTKSGAGFGVSKGDSLPFEAPFETQGKPQGVTLSNSSPAPTPTPTPRPTGPGEYACDPYGVCNKYSDEGRTQYCTQTYADSLCLDECGNKEKQCKK